jgi:ABC-type multidrug transport system fused ATPase/permease subunit
VNRETRKVFTFVLKIISDRRSLFFWAFVRFVSAILPLFTIYLYSLIIKQLELKLDFTTVAMTVILIFIVRIVDNYLRLISITRLEHIISNIGFDIHNYFLSDMESKSKEERHATIQAVRNFSEASGVTLNLIKQPGIDSVVSFLFIPVILFVVDFPSFVIVIAYTSIYLLVDTYTTQRYAQLKDIQNSKTEAYYAKLQDSNDFDLEQISYTRHFKRLTRWGFTEWFALQNSAVFFYCLNLFYLIYAVYSGQNDLSHLVLVMGYVTQTQTFLNSFSQIKDSFTDMDVGLKHLAKNEAISAINLEDLI